MTAILPILFFFFFNDTATTEIYTLSLHDALPISSGATMPARAPPSMVMLHTVMRPSIESRSEEHTSELQSRSDLVCRLLLEKKKNIQNEEETVNNLVHLHMCTTE